MAVNGADTAIDLIDNTAPAQPLEQDPTRSETSSTNFLLRKKFTRDNVKSELQKKKFAKWQRDRLEVADGASSSNQSSSRSTTKLIPDQGVGFSKVSGDGVGGDDSDNNVDLLNIAPVPTQATETLTADTQESNSELEILYENQRGWFFFGIPFYSNRSLLQIDPPAWVDKDFHDSPVNITNAQLPDPSWEWAWQTWYVDMSDDVDEEGWQYSFAFVPKFQWHGTHPWFHSYVRRRRWLRLRVKKKLVRMKNGLGPTELNMAHMLNEDYLTIHSQNLANLDPSIPSSVYSRRDVIEPLSEGLLEENIENIPTLLIVLKNTIVDREKIEVLRKFIAQGGEELYYLPEKVSEVLAFFVFQTSRWQFLKLLQDALDGIENENTETDKKEVDARNRRRNNISRTIEAVKQQISQYDIFNVSKENQSGLGDPQMQRAFEIHKASLSSQDKGKETSFNEIRGIPKAAAIGEEGHIY